MANPPRTTPYPHFGDSVLEDPDTKTPYIPADILKYLDAIHPDRCPEPTVSDRDIWIQRGAVGVVRHLRMLYQDQLSKELGN